MSCLQKLLGTAINMLLDFIDIYKLFERKRQGAVSIAVLTWKVAVLDTNCQKQYTIMWSWVLS